MSTELAHEHHHDSDSIDVFGFWMYIMTDCLLFATLFATYAVLYKNTYGGPMLKEFIHLPYVFGETLFLLLSNLTYGFGILSKYKNNRKSVLLWLCVTVVLGLGFVVMEVNEFIEIARAGHSWATSGSMSAFFTLVGTHGLHVSMGLLWMVTLIVQLAKRPQLDSTLRRRLTYLGLFWNFLDIVWIFVFTVVYLMGAI